MANVCNQCGKSLPSALMRFLYSIPDLHTVEEREAIGKPFPEGDYLCMDCATGVQRIELGDLSSFEVP